MRTTLVCVGRNTPMKESFPHTTAGLVELKALGLVTLGGDTFLAYRISHSFPSKLVTMQSDIYSGSTRGIKGTTHKLILDYCQTALCK